MVPSERSVPSASTEPAGGARLLTPRRAAFPILAVLVLLAEHLLPHHHGEPGSLGPTLLMLAAGACLIGSVFSALHFGGWVARWAGEPLGTLILTLTLTIIEASVIVSIMLADDENPTLVRDAVYATVMIVCNGLVGLALLVGAVRYREQEFHPQAAATYLSLLAALSILALVLPNYTVSTEDPTFSPAQLAFVIAVTLCLYAAFLFVQTVRHRDYFVDRKHEASGHAPAVPPSGASALLAFAWLALSLAAVVLLAEMMAHEAETGLEHLGAPEALLGVVVALLVLLPEAIHAIEAALHDELQKSLNVALGASLATIGLTIPAVALVSLVIGHPLILGLGHEEVLLLALTLFVSALSFGTGRTNVLSGAVHLVLFGTFVFLIFTP